ncbi:MAG TPA: glycosyltransferase [Gemmatimonadaceae bacterium]|nr:glycosyltransferase [Gemmatimonadaceae bacterium]
MLLVAPQPFYEDRGTPIAVRQVLTALSELGFAVDVLTYPIGVDLALPGVRLMRSANPLRIGRVPVGFSIRKLVLDASLVPALAAQLARERYDCIHAVEEAAFPAVWLGRRRGIPVIYDMQSSLPEQMAGSRAFRSRAAQRVLRRCERWLLRQASSVVASAGLAEYVRTVVPDVAIREWRFSSLATSAAPRDAAALRATLGIAPTARVVLYSGTFATYQGLRHLLGAMPRVLAAVPDAVFVLVGADGSHRGAAVARAARQIGAGRVLVVERQPREAMPGYLAMADVLVSPRTNGGNLPLKIFDYLASGRPIVATDIATHRAVLDDERAILVEPSAAALAAGIERVLADPAKAARLAAAGSAYAASHLGWMHFLQAVSALYEEVCAGGRAPARTRGTGRGAGVGQAVGVPHG